nr:hypothetical protein [Tanacetum cinerariifolium]
ADATQPDRLHQEGREQGASGRHRHQGRSDLCAGPPHRPAADGSQGSPGQAVEHPERALLANAAEIGGHAGNRRANADRVRHVGRDPVRPA